MYKADNVVRDVLHPLGEDAGVVAVDDPGGSAVQSAHFEGVRTQFVRTEYVPSDVGHHQRNRHNVHVFPAVLRFRVFREFLDPHVFQVRQGVAA